MVNSLEIVMMLATIIYSYLLIYCRRTGFIFGIIASGIMGYILMFSGTFIQAILSYIYAVIYIYSYISWGSKNPPKISNIDNRQSIISVMFIFTFTLIIGYVFSNGGEQHPYLDSFSAACSIVAALLLSKKIIEHSYIFIFSNIASIVICYMAHDYITIVTFFIYIIFNVIRGYMWSKEKIK